MAIVFMATCSIIFMTFSKFFPILYVSKDEFEVIEIATSLIIVAGLFQLSDGAQVVGLGSLRGMLTLRCQPLSPLQHIGLWQFL